jgi:hypothetical protein
VYTEIYLALWVTVSVQQQKKALIAAVHEGHGFSAATGQGGFDLFSEPGLR